MKKNIKSVNKDDPDEFRIHNEANIGIFLISFHD
jgi:hypothetical protein